MPAPFVPNATVIEVAFNQRIYNRPITNVIYWDLLYSPDASDVQATAAAAGAAWVTHMLPSLADTLALISVRARSLATQFSPQVEYAFPAPQTGHKSLGTMSANNAICLTHRTGIPGRSHRGRTFISGVPSAGLSGNYASASWAEELPFSWGSMVSAITTVVDGVHVVYSRRINGAWRAQGLATPVTQTVLRNLRVDSQRRRTGRDV